MPTRRSAKRVAWAMGWLLILEYGLASATVAVGWSGYLVSFLKDFHIIIPPELCKPYFDLVADPARAGGHLVVATGHFNLPAFVGIMAVTALLVIGVSESAKVNNVIVMVKLAVVLMFIAVGAFYVDTANWHPFIPDFRPQRRRSAKRRVRVARHIAWCWHDFLRLYRL